MKVKMGFYLVTVLERIFPDDFNKFKVQQYGFRETLDALKLNKNFKETDKELEMLDDGRYFQQLKVVGKVTAQEFLNWDMYKHLELPYTEDTEGIMTEEGLLGAVMLDQDWAPNYHTGVQEKVVCYVSPYVTTDGTDVTGKSIGTTIRMLVDWRDEWIDWLHTDQREPHPKIDWEVDLLP